MSDYKAPLENIRFLMNDVFNFEKHYGRFPSYQDASPDMVEAIISECARFCENELAPINHIGDKEGCTFNDGEVTTPIGFKDAYQKYIDAGWQGLSFSTEYGGQGLPQSLGLVKAEFMGTANWSFGMYPGLSLGAMNTILAHGSDEQKNTYLPKLTSAEWTGTMCLTEAQCGTDLGQIRTKAEPNQDGSYAISGSKIFISAGEHDMAENIIHIVLARLPNAPKGTRGISLFIVPKFNVDEQGNLLDRNTVNCGSIEDKMGIKASSTAVLNFDGANGYLIGPENKGLECMFTFMNTARIGTALQGVCAAEFAYQKSLYYAKDRLSMRSLTGSKFPDKIADPLIVHPDVRRMLLTQKAFVEGGRAMILYASKAADKFADADNEDIRQLADQKLGFLTPILKAFLTERGFDSANLGIQIYGGHGYIKEWGLEQNLRDARIATLYEGTTGIQALDLIGRKVMLDRGKQITAIVKEILGYCKDHSMISSNPQKNRMHKFVWPLSKAAANWQQYTFRLMLKAKSDRDVVGSASVDYLMYSGYILMAYMWAQMAQAANEKLTSGEGDKEFYKAKIRTAEFYFERIFPQAKVHASLMMKAPTTLMKLEAEAF
ncbi:acyl-CoA dehydrogenase C-terminal domain-containing protein [Thalassotalea sp. Y01]|uniref:acyl-CoA dehydrogenase C-terminal domain-containing protein n=1 Tax=Thalassotalea sp. Y01 TaxID=2729613 RepID=UPI00145C4773|nr:acyl-CoA dehydrogenase C-terminal domain-containing protein [Thalassotalea sp. Y01]NMP17462.1 acyl-CoA dehydrogenase [Thalassotalea sp. Y01]